MTTTSHRNWLLVAVFICAFIAPAHSDAITFDRIIVFGASISDPGNAFALTGEAIKAPYDELDAFLVPDAPYARGGHHFSNGATWIERYAKPHGLGKYVGAAFADGHSRALNYAVGGARARNDGINVNFTDQLAAFLTDVSNVAPSDALYVIDLGANDVRDALAAGDPTILADALNSIAANLGTLYAVGARKFLVLNAPNLAVLPSIRILDGIFPGAAFAAGALSQAFNANLDAVIAFIAALPGVEIAQVNLFQLVNTIMADPAAFGLTEAENPLHHAERGAVHMQKARSILLLGRHPSDQGRAWHLGAGGRRRVGSVIDRVSDAPASASQVSGCRRPSSPNLRRLREGGRVPRLRPF